MQKPSKAIISCALTGSIHTPTMSAALPITSQEMVDQGKAAVAAGAAILHLHARDPHTGRPTPDPAVYQEFIPALASDTDAVINITTGGSTLMSFEERLAAARHFKPEVASMNMGSINFNFSGAAKPGMQWKYDWEEPYVKGSADVIFSNTFTQMERLIRELGHEHGIRFEHECYDVGHLYSLAHFRDRGLVEGPLFIQMIFGILGGIGADQDNLSHMVSVADKLFGDDYHLSVFGAGRAQFPFVTHSALLGGHVRVGLEDSLYIGRGEMATSNAQQVEKVARIVTELGREIATPDDARDMLKLKGRNTLNI